MTKLSSLQTLAAAALACGLLNSCSSMGEGHVDLVNPTASQMDQMDVQWGLPKRASRGTPKRYFAVPEGTSAATGSSSSSEPSSADQSSGNKEASAASTQTAQSSNSTSVDPAVVEKLSQ